MRKINHEPVIITSDQSDIDSNSCKNDLEVQQNMQTINKNLKQDLYVKFTSSQYFNLTSSLANYQRQIDGFLEQKKSALFIFGPSGCGKSSLVRKILTCNIIQFSQVQECQSSEEKIVSLSQSILKSLRKLDSNIVYLCYDFPIIVQKWNANEINRFKIDFISQIKRTSAKIIFVLNQEIYNSFYILNERGNADSNISRLEMVKVLKMEKYGKMQFKKILQGFLQFNKLYEYTHFISGRNDIDQLIELSNSDIRKALLLIYWKGVQRNSQKLRKQQMKKIQVFQKSKNIGNTQYASQTLNNNANKILNQNSNSFSWMNSLSISSQSQVFKTPSTHSQVKTYKQFQKFKSSPNQRVSLYHGLGKLLYGKRLNVKQKPKNKKQNSCYYNEKEIKQLDPPFYFNPQSLYQQLRVPLDIVVALLQENYLERYGKIKDVRNMSNIFKIYDGLFSYINNFEDQQVREIKVRLITWGMLIYNKNSRTDNKSFKPIEKSECANTERKVRQKKRLIYQYFSQSNLHDLIQYAHFIRIVNSRSKLVQVIFNKSLSNKNKTSMDDHLKVFSEEQQQQAEIRQKIITNEIENELKKQIINNQNKKQQLVQLMKEFQEQELSDKISNIDEEDDQLII